MLGHFYQQNNHHQHHNCFCDIEERRVEGRWEEMRASTKRVQTERAATSQLIMVALHKAPLVVICPHKDHTSGLLEFLAEP